MVTLKGSVGAEERERERERERDSISAQELHKKCMQPGKWKIFSDDTYLMRLEL